VAFLEPEFRREDARTAALPAGSFDLVVTSPPYAGVYDYSRHQSRRYPIFGEDPAFAEAHEMGSRRDAQKYPQDLEAVLRNVIVALSASGRALVLIGDGQQVDGRGLLERIAPGIGARVTAAASQRRPNWSGGPPKREHLVLVERATSAAP
jgi:DNA modification methylase